MDSENKYGTLASQQRLLELMKVFHSFCLDNGVVYSMAAGSLLGAIRHKGFIPWDDDLDVFVDRDNYNKIVQLLSCNDELTIDRESKETLWVDRIRRKTDLSEGGYLPTLDLLVLDHVPDWAMKRKLKLVIIMCLQGMMKIKINLKKGPFIYRMGSLVFFCIGKLLPSRWKKSWYRSVSQIGNNNSSRYISNYNGAFADISRLYPSNLMDHVELHKFEDMNVFIVSDWDTCLKTHFGDYMTPPKEEDRKPQHGGKCNKKEQYD